MKQSLIVVFFIFIGINVFSQIDAGPDSAICIGETIMLQGSGPGMYSYTWTSVPNDPTISNPNILTPTVSPSVTTVYTLEARSVGLSNLVSNGNFEQGNTGFTSDYTYSPGPNGLWNEGTYAITTDASYNHNNFTCDYDHTSGSGNFMAVNGAGTPNVVVWSTTVSGIVPNTDYEFSTWVASLSPTSPAILQFRINGVLLGQPFNASNVTCVWKRFFETWDSGNSTSATISIVNQNTATNGNDFSLDDINFNKVTYYYDSCTVTVNDIPTSDFTVNQEICQSDTAIVTYTGTAADTAEYHWEFGSATVISGSGQGPILLHWPDAGLKTVKLWVSQSCDSDTTVKSVSVKQLPTATLTADATLIPYGTTTVLHGFMDGNPGPFDFNWDPAASLQDATSQDPVTIMLQNSTLFTFNVQDQTTLCSNKDTLTVKISGGPLTLLSVEALPDTICLGESTDIQIGIEGGSGNYTATWTSNPPGFNHSGSETIINVNPTVTTTYIVEVNDGFVTSEADSVKVVVLPLIEETLTPADTLIQVGQTAVYVADAINITSYQWQMSDDDGNTWQNIYDNQTFSGCNTSVLNVTNASIALNNNLFRCLFEGKCSPLEGQSALLRIVESPTFIAGAGSAEVCNGEELLISISVENFIEIDSLNFKILFDYSLMEFIDLQNIASGLEDIQTEVNPGEIILNWENTNGLTLENDTILNLHFLSTNDGSGSLEIDQSSMVRNIYGFYPPLVLSAGSFVVNSLAVEAEYVTITPDTINIIDETNVLLEAIGGSGSEIEWHIDSCDGQLIGNEVSFSINPPEQTTQYFSFWKNQCGVTACKSATLVVNQKFSFGMPSAFSPNNDGKNDKFGPVTLTGLFYFRMEIYNRWGQLIFVSDNVEDLWDGTYKGKRVAPESYIWIVKYKYRESGMASEDHSEKGTVTVIY